MLVPVKWIRDYVNIDMDTVEFADKMTMTGTKVETIEFLGEEINNVVVGKIEKIRDNLYLLIAALQSARKIPLRQLIRPDKHRRENDGSYHEYYRSPSSISPNSLHKSSKCSSPGFKTSSRLKPFSEVAAI